MKRALNTKTHGFEYPNIPDSSNCKSSYEMSALCLVGNTDANSISQRGPFIDDVLKDLLNNKSTSRNKVDMVKAAKTLEAPISVEETICYMYLHVQNKRIYRWLSRHNYVTESV